MTNQQTPSPYSCSSSIERHQDSSDSPSQEEASGNGFPSSSSWSPINISRARGNNHQQREGGNIGRYSPPPLPGLQVVDPTSYFSQRQNQIRTGRGCSTQELKVIIDEVLSIVGEDNDDDFLQ